MLERLKKQIISDPEIEKNIFYFLQYRYQTRTPELKKKHNERINKYRANK